MSPLQGFIYLTGRFQGRRSGYAFALPLAIAFRPFGAARTTLHHFLLTGNRQQKLLRFLESRRGFERAQDGALRLRRPAERVVRARDVEVGLGLVGGAQGERRAELRE